MKKSTIGVFDSGYGGLTVLKEIRNVLPQYDYIYLGDNARTPYGTRSFETVYQFTLQAVNKLFNMGCELIIIACNTASAKALRNIQQKDLPLIDPNKRVLGVIRPVAEIISQYTQNKHVGILATTGTVNSESYLIEISNKLSEAQISQEACPIWVPLIENNIYNNPGGEYFVNLHLNNLFQKDPQIDTLVLACTHYPIMMDLIKQQVPSHVSIINQGQIVANSLKDYLIRHSKLEQKLSENQSISYFTTDDPEQFKQKASLFLGAEIDNCQKLEW